MKTTKCKRCGVWFTTGHSCPAAIKEVREHEMPVAELISSGKIGFRLSKGFHIINTHLFTKDDEV